MKILVTGAGGFIGKNLIAELRNQGYTDILEYDIDTGYQLLDSYTKECDFVFHLAGVNRPENQEDFIKGNVEFSFSLLRLLKQHNNLCPIMVSSSVMAELDSPYGQSKRASEDLFFKHNKETGAKVFVYRFPNVFGKWCKPNYNSAVATFCYNIANDLPIKVNDENTIMNLVYIDDVVIELINTLHGKQNTSGEYCSVPVVHTIKLGEIADLLYSFKDNREKFFIPDMADDFTRKLYSTYLSYLPENQFNVPLIMNKDSRGSFSEFFKTPDRGQVSVNIVKPNIIKGNHWHHSKNEKFLVVNGKGLIRLRKVGSDKVVEYHVSGDRLESIDIPTGYTHSIQNVGDTDMVTIMWANECFNPGKPDTYYLEV